MILETIFPAKSGLNAKFSYAQFVRGLLKPAFFKCSTNATANREPVCRKTTHQTAVASFFFFKRSVEFIKPLFKNGDVFSFLV